MAGGSAPYFGGGEFHVAFISLDARMFLAIREQSWPMSRSWTGCRIFRARASGRPFFATRRTHTGDGDGRRTRLHVASTPGPAMRINLGIRRRLALAGRWRSIARPNSCTACFSHCRADGALLRRRDRHGDSVYLGDHQRSHAYAMERRPQCRLQPCRSQQLYAAVIRGPLYHHQAEMSRQACA